MNKDFVFVGEIPYRRVNIIMLPTEEVPKKGDILLRHIWKGTKNECKSLWQYNETITIDSVAQYTTLNGSFRDSTCAFKPQHLYILSDEEIKGGDHCIVIDRFGNKRLCQNIEKGRYKVVGESELSERRTIFTSGDKFYKVVASTDQSLGLPRPSDPFVKKFVDEEGKIEEALLEYSRDYLRTGVNKLKDNFTLKVAKDNTVTIQKTAILGKKLKRYWPTKEVNQLMLDAYRYALKSHSISISFSTGDPESGIKNFIQEKLHV